MYRYEREAGCRPLINMAFFGVDRLIQYHYKFRLHGDYNTVRMTFSYDRRTNLKYRDHAVPREARIIYV